MRLIIRWCLQVNNRIQYFVKYDCIFDDHEICIHEVPCVNHPFYNLTNWWQFVSINRLKKIYPKKKKEPIIPFIIKMSFVGFSLSSNVNMKHKIVRL